MIKVIAQYISTILLGLVFAPQFTAAADNAAVGVRSASLRQGAVNKAAKVVSDARTSRAFVRTGRRVVEYSHTARSVYNRETPIEVYRVGALQIEVNALTDDIVQFGPSPREDRTGEPLDIDFTSRFTEADLSIQAREFLLSHAGPVDLDVLLEKVSDKEGTVFFFRWEDLSRTLEPDMHPFVQVGITGSGEIVSYTNTLEISPSTEEIIADETSNTEPLSDRSVAALPRAATAGPAGVYIFANNGSSWSESGSWYTTFNEGYCGHIRVCPGNAPTSMRWAYETDMWQWDVRTVSWSHPYSQVWADMYVFIPRVNATTRWADYSRGSYRSDQYPGSSNFSLDQLVYSDVFVSIGRYLAPSSTGMTNVIWGVQNRTGRKVGADEMRVIY